MPSNLLPSLRPSLQESVAIATVVFFLVLTGAITWRAFAVLERNRDVVGRTHEVLLTLERIESALKDAETGQRGYIITGRDEYLQPFEIALRSVNGFIDQAKSLTADNPKEQASIGPLEFITPNIPIE